MTTTIQIDRQMLIHACAMAGLNHTIALRIMAYLPPIGAEFGTSSTITPEYKAAQAGMNAAASTSLDKLACPERIPNCPECAPDPVNQMRITLTTQINALIDVADRYARRMQKVDDEEHAYVIGAISHAMQVVSPYKYHGPYRVPAGSTPPISDDMRGALAGARSMFNTVANCSTHGCEDCREHATIHRNAIDKLLGDAGNPISGTASQVDPRQALPHKTDWSAS